MTRYLSQTFTSGLPNHPWHAKAHFSTLVYAEGTLVFDFADNGQFLILVSKFILVQKTVRSDNLLSKGKKEYLLTLWNFQWFSRQYLFSFPSLSFLFLFSSIRSKRIKIFELTAKSTLYGLEMPFSFSFFQPV